MFGLGLSVSRPCCACVVSSGCLVSRGGTCVFLFRPCNTPGRDPTPRPQPEGKGATLTQAPQPATPSPPPCHPSALLHPPSPGAVFRAHRASVLRCDLKTKSGEAVQPWSAKSTVQKLVYPQCLILICPRLCYPLCCARTLIWVWIVPPNPNPTNLWIVG